MMERKELIRPGEKGGKEFEKIVENYGAQAMAFAMNILGNRQDAEDACQEAFFQVYRHLEKYDSQRSLKTWLLAILYRRCLDLLRKKRRFFNFLEKARHQPLVASEELPFLQSQGLSTDLLRCLKAKERAALSLWACEGCTSEEISQVLGCSASTARVYLYQARKKLKALMEKKND